jgi:hypothetical protein
MVHFERKRGIREETERTFHKPAPIDKSISNLHNNKTDMELWTLCWALFLLLLFYDAVGS